MKIESLLQKNNKTKKKTTNANAQKFKEAQKGLTYYKQQQYIQDQINKKIGRR